MKALANYQILTKISEGDASVVYRGLRQSDNLPVVLKLLKRDYPTPAELTRYKQEYEITRSLSATGAIATYELIKVKNTLAIVFEDFGGESLRHFVEGQTLSIVQLLKVALELARTLADIHTHQVIHKDINPSNIVYNGVTHTLKLIDFGISTALSLENPALKPPVSLEGTLPYMSPEQTGRMNRFLDYRTDFYSLGATLYELFSGSPLFVATDAMEWVHCHIAKQPVSLSQINPEVPQTISDIVMKLLAKNAEDRYQSAWGIYTDLAECWQQVEKNGTIIAFTPGQSDFTDKFQIPQKLYGRTAEIQTLLSTFERTSQGASELFLISGYSGVGKSSLVQEIYKPITQQRGYFIAGKFDQLQRNLPYSALVSAFQSLVRQILSESPEELQVWREKLLTAFGSNGQVMIEVIPELELIVGEQPKIQELGGIEAQNRFNLTCQNFIRVFAQKEHPLVLFIDDLQWADLATLKLLESILSQEDSQYLFLIGAYRDNEVSATHPLSSLIETLQKQQVRISQIHLNSLAFEHVRELISDTLHAALEQVEPLANLVMEKTHGNAFFVSEFLKNLYAEKLLSFDVRSGWNWNIEQIKARDIADNVIELTIQSLQRLPDATQKIIKLAACIGDRFELNTLSSICQQESSFLFQQLLPAIETHLIQPLSDLELPDRDLFASQPIILSYKFLHDRVQQAAYTLIEDTKKQKVHWQIGQRLLTNTPVNAPPDLLFQIVDHLNLGQTLASSEVEKIQLAQLNLEAAQKAKISAAYAATLIYSQNGANCLPEDCWKNYYKLTLALYKEWAEAEYLNGCFEKSEALIQLILQRAKTLLEKAEICRLLIVQYTLKGDGEAAIQAGKKALSLVGIDLPERHLKAEFEQEMAKIDRLLEGKSVTSLIKAPDVAQPEHKIILSLLANIDAALYVYNQELWLFVSAKVVHLLLQYGHLPEASAAYSNYGVILGVYRQDYQLGTAFAELSLQVAEKYHNLSQKCQSGANCNWVFSWTKPIRYIQSLNESFYHAGLESGQFQWAGYILMWKVFNQFYQGETLGKILQQIPNYLHFAETTQNHWSKTTLLATYLVTYNLSGASEDELNFDTDLISEADYLSEESALSCLFANCTYLILKSQTLYIYDRFQLALDCLAKAQPYLDYISGSIALINYNFYQSLCLIALYRQQTEAEQCQSWQVLIENQKQLKLWAENCPENCLDKYLLVEAEIGRISGKGIEIIDLYDRAIAAAKDPEFSYNEALANELAARFLLELGKDRLAQVYLRDAYHGYQCWGAQSKLGLLQRQYPQLLATVFSPAPTVHSTINSTRFSTTTNSGVVLDLAAVMKASQALSSEIVLEKLLNQLMKIVLESAGAQFGFLILEREGELLIEAAGSVEMSEVRVLESMPVSETQALPHSVVYYVARTHESVVLQNATEDAQFSHDPYIQLHQPRSLLCTPILKQGELLGMLYLENNLIEGAFASDPQNETLGSRLEILQLLCSQAAISLENARLYQTLQNSELRERQKATQLEASLRDLEEAQLQLVQSEKMSTLGQLVAGIAHEINNPVGFISGNLKYASEYIEQLLELLRLYQIQFPQPGEDIVDLSEEIEIDYLAEDLPKLISSMTEGTERIYQISASLRTFSRADTTHKVAFDLHEGLDSTLMILKHRLKANEVRPAIAILKNYGPLPEVYCYPGQLNQVFMNIIANAIEAIDEFCQTRTYEQNHTRPSTISISTTLSQPDTDSLQPYITIRIQDNGPGMTPEVLQKIFNRLFTTKAVGTGTGLGLSISRQIVEERHGGRLQCLSAPGQGAEFLIDLPLA
ncbi:AAA family ATPase [Oscillatoria amoena NRMC-F 0135]|nr:AAA family ATPase [Geitlerinema splendidum]MDL5047456.1 AAA family ATPase [Oscillatoria amoena NRMC-F 0135]